MHGLAYTVGRFTLEPHRQLLKDGALVQIGRKPLALLSVLALAEGALVTKDELMAAVWPNAIVEENAIQAQIVSLRKMLGTDAGLLSTVRGLGYRLVASVDQATPQTPNSKVVRSSVPARRSIGQILLATVPLIVVGVSSLWPSLHRPPSAPVAFAKSGPSNDRFAILSRTNRGGARARARIAVLPFEPATGAAVDRRLADDVSFEIADVLDRAGLIVTPPRETADMRGASPAETARRLGASFVFYGTVRNMADGLRATFRIDEARSGVTVLSGSEEAASADRERLPSWIAAQGAEAISSTGALLALEAASRTNAARAADYLRAYVDIRAGRFVDGFTAARGAAAAHPASGVEQFLLAYATIYALGDLPADQRAPALAIARTAALRAAALLPDMGDVRIARCKLWPTELARCERIYRAALAIDPDARSVATFLVNQLMQGGRFADAGALAETALANAPFNPTNSIQSLYLVAMGRDRAEERQTLNYLARYWPRRRFTRQWLVALVSAGRIAEARALLADPVGGALIEPRDGPQPIHAVLRALASGSASDRVAARDSCRADWSIGVAMPVCIDGLALLGERDAAFALAEQVYPGRGMAVSGDRWLLAHGATQEPGFFLFAAGARALRADPRFMEVAQRLGLVAYWRKTGRWPDFCSEPGLPYDCRAEAAKVAGDQPHFGPLAAGKAGGGALDPRTTRGVITI